MSRTAEHTAQWMYRGIWGVLTRWFRVPGQPPTLPAVPGEQIQSFQPSPGFLRYLKFQFWLTFLLLGLAVTFIGVMLIAGLPIAALFLAPLLIASVLIPGAISYLALHLRYDTSWYVLSSRSLRIRSGIVVIHEATITFENVQNVSVESGPIERWFGIGNVNVDTAGGSQGGKDAHGKGLPNLHRGVIAGVSDAAEIRQLILNSLLQSRFAGLGDEQRSSASGWSPDHTAVLREIRDAILNV